MIVEKRKSTITGATRMNGVMIEIIEMTMVTGITVITGMTRVTGMTRRTGMTR